MNDRPAYKPPFAAAGVAAAAVWILYAITLAPTTAFWDTSEYIATAHILGIPHPPGNPTFVVLARAWELLLAPLGLSAAVRVNLFSATMGALAHGCWFLVAHRITAYFTPERVHRMVGASLAVLVSATAFTVWSQSNVNEKVYTVSLFTIALLSWLAFMWRDNLGKGKDDNLILLVVFILALSVGNHLMAFLAAPALLVFIGVVEWRTLLNWKLYLFAAAVAFLGLSIHLYLPLRAALGPVINEADPSTLTSLWESLTRQQYDKPSVFSDPTDPSLPRQLGLIAAQLGNYFQYFDWQWARTLNASDSLFGGLGTPGGGFPIRPVITLVFAALGVYGAYEHYHRDRTSWWYLLILFFTLSVGLVGYLNFRYGYSYPEPGGGYDMALHEVRERDYFFIASFSLWGLWTGLGLFAVWQRLTAMARESGRFSTGVRQWAAASPILLLALVPLVLNWERADRSDDYAARDWAYNLLMSTEPYAVLFTNGDNDTFPLWYLQEVEGIRRDVTVIVTSYLNTAWYAKQLKDHTAPCGPDLNPPEEDTTTIACQRPFQPEVSAGFYGTGWPTPTRSILASLTHERIESIPRLYTENPYNFLLREPLQVEASELSFTVPPNQVLLPADVYMLNVIQDSIGDRPVYFATTTRAYERLGLGRNLVREGLALKLVNGPVRADPSDGIYPLPSNLESLGPYIDLPRTDALLWEVILHRSGLPDEWEFWREPSSLGIPSHYRNTHLAAYGGHAIRGDEREARRHLQQVEEWDRLAATP